MRNAGLEEAQAGIKISGRNINDLRYADDTTLIAESEQKFKSINSSVLSLLYGQLSHPSVATEKTIALTIWTFVTK